jgi:hypothetical protein
MLLRVFPEISGSKYPQWVGSRHDVSYAQVSRTRSTSSRSLVERAGDLSEQPHNSGNAGLRQHAFAQETIQVGLTFHERRTGFRRG